MSDVLPRPVHPFMSSAASDELWYTYSLPVSSNAHPDYSAEMPTSFAGAAGLAALKSFMSSGLSHENARAAKSDLAGWDETKWKGLQEELVGGVSKLQMVRTPAFTQPSPGVDEFHPGKGTPIEGSGHMMPARVLSFVNVRVYRSEEGGAEAEGRYLVLDGGAPSKGGWKLINAPVPVGGHPAEVARATLSSALGAVEGAESSRSSISMFELMDVLTTDPEMQLELTPVEQQGLQTGVPKCPGEDIYGSPLECIMQIFLFEADVSLLEDAPEFSRTNGAGETISMGWEMMPKQTFEDHFEIDFLSPDELIRPTASGETPGETSGECENERRRMQVSAAPESVDEWEHEWRHRFECWWLALPMPSQASIGSCLGALGLHLSSRFHELMGGTAMGGTARASRAAEANCDWVREGAPQLDQLPDFPQAPPHGFSLPAVPAMPTVPRLLPTWERLELLSQSGERGGLHAAEADQAAPIALSLAAGAGGALAAIALGGVLALSCGRTKSQRCRRSTCAAIASSNRVKFESR